MASFLNVGIHFASFEILLKASDTAFAILPAPKAVHPPGILSIYDKGNAGASDFHTPKKMQCKFTRFWKTD
jgi:hypothetical protein